MLQYNEKKDVYVVTSDNEQLCKSVGLTLSRSVFGPNGERVWFTDCPYAAVNFFDEGDADVQGRLARIKRDLDASRATDWDIDIPAPRGKEYMPFQRAGIGYSVERPHALIGDEPGLGKTIQAIGVSNWMRARRTVIVCPGSIRLNWLREIREWAVMRGWADAVLSSKQGIHPDASWIIISYDLLRNEAVHDVLCNMDIDHLILDEGHYLKSTEAKRTRAVFGGGQGRYQVHYLAKRARRITALTGTPLPNRPRECYTLAKSIHFESIDWMSFENFTYRFNPSAMLDNGHVMEKKGRLPELRARLRSNFLIRRLKNDVLKDLPDKTYELAYVEKNGEIRRALKREAILGFDVQDLIEPHAAIQGQISTVRREMGEAKVPRIVEHMTYLLDGVELPKVVLFLHHKSVIDAVSEKLGKYGVCVLRGGMSSKAKNENVEMFKNDSKNRVFIGQLEAGGVGIDGLQNVCSHVVVGEPSWTPGSNEQAIDRLHRHGQHQNVVAQFLVVEGSMDEKVLAGILDKAATIHGALDAY